MSAKVISVLGLLVFVLQILPYETVATKEVNFGIQDRFMEFIKPATDAIHVIEMQLVKVHDRLREFKFIGDTERQLNEMITKTKNSVEDLADKITTCARPCNSRATSTTYRPVTPQHTEEPENSNQPVDYPESGNVDDPFRR